MALEKVKERVYKNRIRLMEFFTDFDKLRCGNITATQFKSGLSMAGLDLNAVELEELVAAYPSTNVEKTVCYRDFCDEVNNVFTKYNLEKIPLEEVPANPAELLEPLRFQTLPRKQITTENRLNFILDAIATDCYIRRILVKPFFDDACSNQNSPMKVCHVTPTQFSQVLKNHVARDLPEDDVKILIDKFSVDGMVNYVAFAEVVDPKEPVYDPYSLV